MEQINTEREPDLRLENKDEAITSVSFKSPHDTAGSPSTLQLSANVQPSTAFCKRCSSLDIPELFNRDLILKFNEEGQEVLELGNSPAMLRAASCPLCRFFGSVAQHYDGDGRSPYYLKILPAHLMFTDTELSKGYFKSNVLSVQSGNGRWESHWLQLLNLKTYTRTLESNFRLRLLDPTCFDIELASHWIDYCQTKHTTDCLIGTIEIPSFRVIDCVTEKIIKAPVHCQYVALSYVWGAPSDTTSEINVSQPVFTKAPKLIVDSMEVTKKLGFRYLWVDRYCINQLDALEKHDQICQMDVIYAAAQLTIIAAGSNEPTFGLHGVRGTARKPQPTVRVGDYQFVSSFRAPLDVVPESKWSTRGWTSQEGLLSRRRLIFTAEQVFFECNSMQCAEALHLPLDVIHNKATGKAVSSSYGAFTLKNIGDNPSQFIGHVNEFTERTLSYQTDALNAIGGIFHAFERGRIPLFQIKGVPILPLYISAGYEGLKMYPRLPEAGFLVGLLWKHDNHGVNRRRTMFPSWSWAGWELGVSDDIAFEHRSKLSDFKAQVSTELPNGTLLRFPSNHNLIPQFVAATQDASIIHITAKISACEIIGPETPVTDGVNCHNYHVLLVGDSKINICLRFSPNIWEKNNNTVAPDCSLIGKKLTAIIFAPDIKPEYFEWQVSVIVVEERGDGSLVERVGVCQIATASSPRMNGPVQFLPNSYLLEHTSPYPTPNQQAFMEWFDRRPIRTIRLG